MQRSIFVFGANEAGRHGRGAARAAKNNHGAIYGQGVGLQGDSYAIPTKDRNIQTLPLWKIETYVKEFIQFAAQHSEMQFNVTRIGCGLAGYIDENIAPLFRGAPDNCILPEGWRDLIEKWEQERDKVYAIEEAEEEQEDREFWYRED